MGVRHDGLRCAPLAAVITAGILVVLPAEVAAADRTYAAAGARATETTTEPKSGAEVVRPTDQGTFPLIVASHGFSASGENQIGWAKHFASWGFVVAVPSFPSPLSPDHQANANTIAALVKELTGPAAATFRVAPGKYGLEGHSAGGLSTTLASADLAPSAVVLFDPVDANDAGKAAYAKLCVPVLGIFAASSSCNGNGGWRGFANATKSELVAFDVVGSTHCDGENAPRALCGAFCGGAANPTRQAAYAHYATAFFLSHVSGDTAAAAKIGATAMSGDAEIASVLRAAATCTPPAPQVDAGGGPPPVPGKGTDAGASSSGTPPVDPPAPSSTPSSAQDSSSGCACHAAGGRSGMGAGIGIGAAVAALFARRRRHARRMRPSA